MNLMKFDHGVTSRVVTVYFPEDSAILSDFSQWSPVLLPANLADLHTFVGDKMSHSLQRVEPSETTLEPVYMSSKMDGEKLDPHARDSQSFWDNLSIEGIAGTENEVYDSGFNEYNWDSQCDQASNTGHVGQYPNSGGYPNNNWIPPTTNGPVIPGSDKYARVYDESRQPNDDIYPSDNDAAHRRDHVSGNTMQAQTTPHNIPPLCVHVNIPSFPVRAGHTGHRGGRSYISPRRFSNAGTDVSSEVADINNDYNSS